MLAQVTDSGVWRWRPAWAATVLQVEHGRIPTSLVPIWHPNSSFSYLLFIIYSEFFPRVDPPVGEMMMKPQKVVMGFLEFSKLSTLLPGAQSVYYQLKNLVLYLKLICLGICWDTLDQAAAWDTHTLLPWLVLVLKQGAAVQKTTLHSLIESRL